MTVDRDPQTLQNAPKDDVVLWIVIAFCLVSPVVLATLWAFYDLFYPPMLLATLLGIAVAALTYRYLGGTGGSQFSVGALKIVGSAALLLGTAWVTNTGLASQMSAENLPKQLTAANRNVSELTADRNKLLTSLQSAQEALAEEKRLRKSQLIAAVEDILPGSEQSKQLVQMASEKRGPFGDVEHKLELFVGVGSYIIDKTKFTACDSPQQKLSDRKLRLSRVIDVDGPDAAPVIELTSGGMISASTCDNKDRKFVIQIHCEAGRHLFPDHIASCGANRNPGWKHVGKDASRVFAVTAEFLAKNGL